MFVDIDAGYMEVLLGVIIIEKQLVGGLGSSVPKSSPGFENNSVIVGKSLKLSDP